LPYRHSTQSHKKYRARCQRYLSNRDLDPYRAWSSRARIGIGQNTKSTDRACDVLDLDLAQIVENEIELVSNLVARRARKADSTGVSEALKAGRDIDPVTVDVVALNDHIAKIDANAKFDALVFRHILVALGHATLDRHGAFDRVHDAGELDQRAVAHQLDDAPSMLSDGWIDELLTKCLEARERSRLVGPNEPAVADHICGEDRGQPALDLCRHGVYLTSLQGLPFQLRTILSRVPWIRESRGCADLRADTCSSWLHKTSDRLFSRVLDRSEKPVHGWRRRSAPGYGPPY